MAINSFKVSLYSIYLIFVFAGLKKEHGSFTAFFSIQKNPNLLWFIVLLGSFIFLWLMELFILFIAITGTVAVMFTFIAVSSIIVPFIFINAILIMALKKPLIFYIHQGITPWMKKDGNQHTYAKGFIELMEKEYIFKDPELTLHKSAGLLKVNPKYLSLILNRQLHSSFPDIVNKYRIETCKKLLENGKDLTIQQIMYDVGYSSKSAFLKHFKRITGCTPSEYKTKLSKKDHR
jgi:AraC-like DNA-binding protein